MGKGAPVESLETKLGESGGGGGRSKSSGTSSSIGLKLDVEFVSLPGDILTGLMTRLPWLIVLAMI